MSLDDNEDLLPEAEAEEVRKVRSAARHDLRQLLKLAPEERARRIEAAESRRSFRSRALIELLLTESRRRAAADPDDAENLARVAGLVLHWTPGRLGERWRDGVAVRVQAHRANALRLAGRLDEADQVFRELHTRLLRTRCDVPRASAEVAGWEAALALARGDGAAAVRLLAWCVHFHRRDESRRGMAGALSRQAEVRALEGDVEGAVDALRWALRVLDPAAYAGERRRVALRLAHLLADAGRLREAARWAASVGEPSMDDGAEAGAEALSRWRWIGGRLAGEPGPDRPRGWPAFEWQALAALPPLERAWAALDAAGEDQTPGATLLRRLREIAEEGELMAAESTALAAVVDRLEAPATDGGEVGAGTVDAVRGQLRRDWLLLCWVD